LLLAAVVVGGCAYLLVRQGDGVITAARRLSPCRVALSALVALVATMCLQRLWRALLGGLGVDVDRSDAAAVFYVSQLGKYVPGSVWPVLAQVELGARWGAPRRVMLGAGLLLIGVVTTTGIAAGALLLPWSSPDGLRRYGWVVVLLPALAVMLHPRVLMSLIDRVSRRTGNDATAIRMSWSALLRACLWSALMWSLLGAHLLVLMTAYGPVGPLDVAAAVGGMGLAWAVGLAFVPAPAGAGVREGVLLLTLTPSVGPGAALAVALASRGLLVLVDVTLAASSSTRRALRGLRVARAGRSAPDRAGSESGPEAPSRRAPNS
jgi:uncharacterized membrane protein YbhN (UPF0104 family)